MSEALARLRATRTGNRSVITRLINEADKILGSDSLDKGRLKTIANLLEEKLKFVEDLDNQILEACGVEEIEGEIETSAAIVSRVLDAQRKISEITKPLPVEIPPQSSSPNQTHAISPNQDSVGMFSEVSNQDPLSLPHRVRSKLPKLVLPKFRGDVTQYRTFWDSFESAVHSNAELSHIDKFNYLNSLLEGQAQRAIQGLPVTEDNYEAAVNILNQRFGKPQQIISAHMDELLKIPACNGDKPSQLRFVYDKVSVHVRGLEALEVNSSQYGSLLIPVIMAKLPPEVRVQIARNTNQDVWEISDLLAVIQREVEAREISENVKVNSEQRKEQPAKPHRNLPTAATLVARDSTVSSDGVPQCVYCSARHFSASCDRVTDVINRKEILKRDRRCFLCLRKGHRNTQCPSNKDCRRCHGNHHQSVCERRHIDPRAVPFQPQANHAKLAQETNRSSENSNPTSVSHTTTASSKGQSKVLLQTVATFAQADHQSDPVPVRILLDCGSQRSYCTNALKEKLALVPTKTETLSLNTFGDERFTKQRCDLVKLTLQGKNEDIKISALCFPKICSPLPTTLDLTRYPHLQGVQLADVNVAEGNHSNIDILIGSDYYFDVVTGEIIRGVSGPGRRKQQVWMGCVRPNARKRHDYRCRSCKPCYREDRSLFD